MLGQPITFKVLTLNAHKGFNLFNRRFVLHELREAVRGVGADLVFLQEVLGDHQLYASRHARWPPVPQYEFLADTIWRDFAYGRNAIYPHGHHGNAMLSKFPIVKYRNVDISIAGPERRGLLHCELRVPDRSVEIHAVCIHLGLLGEHREQQLRLLCELVDNLPSDAPLVIAGDFNDWRVQADRVLGGCAGLREAFAERFGQVARTFPSRWPLLRLDRIYYRNAVLRLPSVLSKRPWSHLSDHAALTAELELS